MTRARDVANLIGSGNFSSTTFTATAGQTAFTISHTQGFIQVFMNGLLLDETVDYTSNGSAVTLTSGAAAGDEIEVVAYNTFSVGDALNQAAADTRYVNTTGDTMSGNLTVGGLVSATGTSTLTNPEADLGIYHTFKNLSSNINTGVGIALGSNNNSGATMYAQRTGANNEHKMGFSVRDSSGGSITRMAISGSGAVTKPYQPNFFAYTSTDYTSTGLMTGGSNWGEAYDTGNNFSAGTFTAPVAGRYLFSVMWDANSIQSTIYMRKNNVDRIKYEPTGRTDNTWETHHYSAMIELAANDYVTLYLNMHSQSSSYPAHMGSVGQWGHFAGYLIG